MSATTDLITDSKIRLSVAKVIAAHLRIAGGQIYILQHHVVVMPPYHSGHYHQLNLKITHGECKSCGTLWFLGKVLFVL